MTPSRLSAVPLAVAALLAFVLPGGANAVPTSSAMTLTVTGSEGALAMTRLNCDPPGGDHPKPKQACQELAVAGGDFEQLQEHLVACTMELRPVTARAHGAWNGEPVHWQQEFSNPCMLRAATGTIFDF